MDDDKPEKPDVADALDVEDLDPEPPEAEAVKGGAAGGGDYSATGGFKHSV